MTYISTEKLKPASLPAAGGNADNPPKGIGIILMALFFFSCSDLGVKLLTRSLPPFQIVWLRYLLFVALIAPLALIMKGPSVFRTQRPGWQFIRALGTLGSAVFVAMAFRFLPMAETMAMNFVYPVFVTALSIVLLGEKVGIKRWVALVVGLVGVLIVIRPGTSAFHPAAIFPVLAAASWAFGMIATRKTSFSDDAWTALTYSAIIGLIVVTFIVPFFWKTPSSHDLLLALAVGCLSTIAQVLLIFAYRVAPASVLAPFSYSQLIWATLFGYLAFSDVPDRWTIVGAMVIAASGLYIAHREPVVAQQRRRDIL